MQEKRIRLGISACLLGEPVRYDGGHKLDRFLKDTLGKYMDYLGVCPEMECGMPVPREPVRLVGKPGNIRMLTRESKRDVTDQMLTWARRRVEELKKETLCGFIFKAKSPSSGMERVKLYNEAGNLIGATAGLFAAEFMKAFPLLPVEDEGRLNDPDLRENFIERIFTLNRYREAVAGRPSIRALTEFHARHKYLIMAHSETHMRKMGRLLASAGKTTDLAALRESYETLLLQALAVLCTPQKHTNVLHHMMGFVKDHLSPDEKQELLGVIEEYKQELVPLVVPVTLLQHYVRKYDVAYLKDQLYLAPHPVELKLRNHA